MCDDSESKYLDLHSMLCVSDCSNGLLPTSFIVDPSSGLANTNYLYCREPVYYIDPTSEAEYEFGTLLFPYKNLLWPTQELFYNLQGVDNDISFLIKGGTESLQ